MSLAGLAIVIVGIWLLLQATAGGLGARLSALGAKP